MSEWKEYKLGELTSKIGSGSTPRGGSNNYKDFGISLIRSQNVLDFSFSKSGLAFIDDEQADELKGVTVKENDILFNITGDSVARCCVVPKQYLPARVNQHVAIIRTNNLADYKFVFYYLQYLKPEMLINAEIGATRNAITKVMLENVQISLPPLTEQKSIASILSSLDDKIDLLQRQNATLEAMAETLFRQWFVEEAKEEWGEGMLNDLATFYNGKSRPKEDGQIPIYGGNGILGYANTFNYSGKSIIIGRVGAYCGSLYYENKEIWVSDNALLVKAKNKNYIHYLFYLLKTLDLNSMAEGSSHPLITQTLLKSLEINIAPEEKVLRFDEQVEIFRNKITANNIQIRTLTTLRDVLLPKLMSGEVRVVV